MYNPLRDNPRDVRMPATSQASARAPSWSATCKGTLFLNCLTNFPLRIADFPWDGRVELHHSVFGPTGSVAGVRSGDVGCLAALFSGKSDLSSSASSTRPCRLRPRRRKDLYLMTDGIRQRSMYRRLNHRSDSSWRAHLQEYDRSASSASPHPEAAQEYHEIEVPTRWSVIDLSARIRPFREPRCPQCECAVLQHTRQERHHPRHRQACR